MNTGKRLPCDHVNIFTCVIHFKAFMLVPFCFLPKPLAVNPWWFLWIFLFQKLLSSFKKFLSVTPPQSPTLFFPLPSHLHTKGNQISCLSASSFLHPTPQRLCLHLTMSQSLPSQGHQPQKTPLVFVFLLNWSYILPSAVCAVILFSLHTSTQAKSTTRRSLWTSKLFGSDSFWSTPNFIMYIPGPETALGCPEAEIQHFITLVSSLERHHFAL